MISLLIYLLIFALVLYIIYYVAGMLLPPKIMIIVALILGLSFLLYALKFLHLGIN